MKNNEKMILMIYFILVGLGPRVIYFNKYTIALLPMLCLLAVIYLTKEDWLRYDFNLIKSSGLVYWIYKGLQYCIYTHAIGFIIFGNSLIKPEELSGQFPIIALYTVLTGPIIEETVFRKIIYGYLSRRFNFWKGSLISSVLFSVSHFSIEKLLTYFAVGMIFCYIYRRTNSLVPNIFAHSLLNIIALIASTIRT